METSDIQLRIDECKALIRRVRTPAGARRFGQPIGSIIVRDLIPNATRRRKRSQRTGKASRIPEVSLAQNTPTERSLSHVDAASVAPDIELPEIPDEKVPNHVIGMSSRAIQRYRNEAPMFAQVDWEYLNTATHKQALIDLDEMGVQLHLTPMFRKDRDFMVSLAETIRIHEEMFPGFIYRHGNIYGGSTGMGAPPRALAYNRIIEREDPEDDSISALKPDDHVYSTMGGQRSGPAARGTSASHVTGGYYNTVSTDMNQTITVFLPGTLNSGSMASAYGRSEEIAWSAAGDWGRKASTNSNSRISNMMYVMTHEFGHAINHAVSGNLSFEIDGWEDPEQYKRRWYSEYAANAMLDTFAELGVVERTGKKYVADDIKAQAEIHKNVKKAQKEVEEYEDFLIELRDTLTGRNETYTEVIGKQVAEGYPELSEEVRKMMVRYPDSTPSNLISPLELASLLKSRLPPSTDFFEGAAFGRAEKARDFRVTFRDWERQGYITNFNQAKWSTLVSEYGATKVVEFEAETWASYMLSGDPTKAALLWGNMVHDMYTWWVQDDMDSEFGKNNPEEG